MTDVDQFAADIAVCIQGSQRFRDVVNVVNFDALGDRHPQLADNGLICLAGGIILDPDITVAVFSGEFRHYFCLTKVALILGGRADKLIRDQFEHMMHGTLAGDLVNNRRHLLLR